MRSVKISLAGAEYELHALPMRQAREFRQKFSQPLEALIHAFSGSPESISGRNLNDLQAVGELIDIVREVLIGSIDLVWDILFDYSPELRADRERLEAEAYDDEGIAAIVEVVKLLYPFGALTKLWSGPGK